AYRCLSQMPQVAYAQVVFSDAVDAALELVSMYENLGDKTQVVRVATGADAAVPELKAAAIEQPVCADWKHQSKMMLRALVGKAKDSFEGTPTYVRLTEALSALRQA
ncbi:hypothetical protein GGF41_008179, partial [Coemansia sp. RSA 2531]